MIEEISNNMYTHLKHIQSYTQLDRHGNAYFGILLKLKHERRIQKNKTMSQFLK